jgi:4'-phosphopantetheinyl transferase
LPWLSLAVVRSIVMNVRHLQHVPHRLSTGVQIWLVDLDAYAAGVALDRLAAPEYARAARMAFARDGERFLASRHALRQVLANALDRSPEGLVIEPDDFGKPHLVHGSALHFSVSRSAHEALIGTSRDREIGVDIEVLQTVTGADTLVREHFTDAERAEWSRTAEGLRDRTFLACWTRKEACVKALGVGLSAAPASINVGCAPHVGAVTIPLGMRRCEVTLHSLHLPSQSAAAVALAAPEVVGMARQFFQNHPRAWQPPPPA